MIHILKIVCLTSLLAGQNTFAQTKQFKTDTEKQLKIEQEFSELENKWMNGWKNKDEAVCSEILADDFTLTSSLSKGDLITKEQWLAALPIYTCKSFRFDKIKVRTYGNTAVVNSWFHQEANVNGNDWNGDFLITDVWVKKNANWQVVSRHANWLQNK